MNPEETRLPLYLTSRQDMVVMGAQEEAAATKEEGEAGVLEGVPLPEVVVPEVARQEVQGSEGTAVVQEGAVAEGARRAQILREVGRRKRKTNHVAGRGVMIEKWREVEGQHEECMMFSYLQTL
jgi:hypothetical protein